MTEPTPENSAPAPVQVTVNVQYIKDFSFESPNAPLVFVPTTTPPTINVTVNVQTRGIAEKTYEVLLLLKMEALIETKAAFIAELTYGGVFTIPVMPEEQLKYFLLVEAPHLLFPSARAILATAVRDGGFPQIFVAPIDFASMYQASNKKLAEPPAGQA